MLGLEYQQTVLLNKIATLRNEFSLLLEQRKLSKDLSEDYIKMLEAEERMFALGESSLFLINNRENALISNRLALAAIESRLLGSVAEFYRTTAEFP
ncbi:TolC family protein [Flavobacterium sp. MAH-1]|nr:TolC family protein [Flavobacterium agri]NUY81939.1 TolC family protein [Flavobacterium agri]